MTPASALNTPPPSFDPIIIGCGMDEADDELKEGDPYPNVELEWLATTAFNHGVDYYLRENDKQCKEWAERAFVLAQWVDDKGSLRDALMGRYATLKLPVEE